ncbi:MAG: methyl-accepting chemotaxis protein [Solirubrobacterales bacterium]
MGEHHLIIENQVKSHFRIHVAMAIVSGLAVMTTLGVLLSGSDKHLTIGAVIMAVSGAVLPLFLSWLFVAKNGTKWWSKYVSITTAVVVLIFYQLALRFNPELFMIFFIPIVLSVMYIESGPVLYASILAIISEALFLVFIPELRPVGDAAVRSLGLRFTMYLQIGAIAWFCARVARDVLLRSIDTEQQATSLSDNLGKIVNVIKGEAAKLATLAETMLSSSHESQDGEQRVSAAIGQIASAARSQAKESHETTSVIAEMSRALGSVGHNVESVSTMTAGFQSIVDQGFGAVKKQGQLATENLSMAEEATRTVNELNRKSQAIVEIVELITGIAGQTNLLALNAAIEAARAGEQGRGFAVVSDEVRKLAEESGQAANKIAVLIGEIQQQTKATVDAMDKMSTIAQEQQKAVDLAEKLFGDIDTGSKKIDDSVQEVSAAVEEMLASTDEVVRAVESISAASQETAASTEEISHSAEKQLMAVQRIADEAEDVRRMAAELEGVATL